MITGHWYMILVLLLVVLIFYGPGKLPEIGGAVGKGIREFRKSVDGVTNKVGEETATRVAGDDVKGPADAVVSATAAAAPPAETVKEHSSLPS